MNDTPRTDSSEPYSEPYCNCTEIHVPKTFARQLERELNAALEAATDAGRYLSGVPKDAKRVEAYIQGNRLILLGTPSEDDESHDCDMMGCGLCHVIARIDWPVTNAK